MKTLNDNEFFISLGTLIQILGQMTFKRDFSLADSVSTFLPGVKKNISFLIDSERTSKTFKLLDFRFVHSSNREI